MCLLAIFIFIFLLLQILICLFVCCFERCTARWVTGGLEKKPLATFDLSRDKFEKANRKEGGGINTAPPPSTHPPLLSPQGGQVQTRPPYARATRMQRLIDATSGAWFERGKLLAPKFKRDVVVFFVSSPFFFFLLLQCLFLWRFQYLTDFFKFFF